MRRSHRLKISLSLIWAVLTSLAVGAFFYFFEEEAPVVYASNYQIQPLDLTNREQLLAQANHSNFFYQLEAGRYELRFYHFVHGELVENGYLNREFTESELLISSQAVGDQIRWQLNGESLVTADYLEERRSHVGAGAIEAGTNLEQGQPQVLFYFAHYLERDFVPVSLNFLLENLHEENAFERFLELYMVTITYVEALPNLELGN